jgi:hypothetical protein
MSLEHTISDTSSTVTQDEAVVSVRMRRVGAQWVDDGSTFQARSQSVGSVTECPYNIRTRWSRSARFDAVEAQGPALSSIRFEVDDQGLGAMLVLVMRGGPFWESGCQPASPEEREEADRAGMTCNWARNECLWPWDGLRAPRGNPACPLEAGALMAPVNTATHRIDFTCRDDIVEPPAQVATYQVSGYLRLTP